MQNPTQTKITSSVQEHLPIDEIKEGVVVLKDGSLKSVIQVQPQNFGLKSEPEKDGVIASFQSFLNSLEFPIQISAISRSMDLSGYIKKVREASSKETHPLIRLQIENYADFVLSLVEKVNVMDRQFFVTVPYYPSGVDALKGGNKGQSKTSKTNFQEEKRALMERAGRVSAGLEGIGLKCYTLNTEQLIELYYTLYNPSTARNQKLTLALSNIQGDVVEATRKEAGGDSAL